jgi:hypothetical protein
MSERPEFSFLPLSPPPFIGKVGGEVFVTPLAGGACILQKSIQRPQLALRIVLQALKACNWELETLMGVLNT